MHRYNYFVVTFNYYEEWRVLVRAKDVIEAGQKAFDTYVEAGFNKNMIEITRVERIKIDEVIN